MKKGPVLGITVLTLALLAGCQQETASVPELLEPVEVKLDMAEVTRGEIGIYSVYDAELVPFVEELYFTMDGRVDTVEVTYGDVVQEGDVLATLDTEYAYEQQAALEDEIAHITAAGEYENEKAELDIEIARNELAYLVRMGAYEQRIELKRAEITRMEDALIQDQELRYLELEEKKRELEEMKKELGNNKIIAPCSGRVVYIGDIAVGMNVQSYEPLILVADDDNIYLQADYISEAVLNAASILYAQIGSKQYEITYMPYDKDEYLQMMLDEEEIRSRFYIDMDGDELESGQYAAVMTVLSYKEDVLTIPVNALYRDEKGRYVYKDEDGMRIRCEVEVGLVTDTKAEIISGVQEGDMVYVKD